MDKLRITFGWLVLPGVLLFPFFEDPVSMVLFMSSVLFMGLWLFFESMICFREKHFSGFSVFQNIHFYGRNAQILSGLTMFLSFLLFVVPGGYGVMQAILKIIN